MSRSAVVTLSWALALLPVLVTPKLARGATRLELDAARDREALAGVAPRPFRALCAETGIPGAKHCFAKIVTDDSGVFVPDTSPQGYGPDELQAAYGLPETGGNGRIIAAVDAFDYPNAEADLAVYRAQFGLPPCTSASGCFQKVDQNGGHEFPGTDPGGGCGGGWSGETSLDLQMLSATCPDCRILLVETNGPDGSLQTGVNTAARLGAVAISNSYGGGEDPNGGDRTVEKSYTHPGVLITVSAGDTGFGTSYPATSAGVVAVGGTTLRKSASTRGWAETAWRHGGSGCSEEIAKPAWQNDSSCANRMEADVSAVGDPATGVAMYCTDPGGAGGWGVVGGTSVSAPLVAGAFTVLGVPPDPSFAWHHPDLFNDVVTGSNGKCDDAYFCNAGTGYDGPSGWGTPNGDRILASGLTVSVADAGVSGDPGAVAPSGGASELAGGASDAGADAGAGTASGGTSGAPAEGDAGAAGSSFAGLPPSTGSGCAVAPRRASRGSAPAGLAFLAFAVIAFRARRARRDRRALRT